VPLPGGSSDKYGNRYEDRWAAQCAFAVLRETSFAIRVEPPGAEGEGVEFWVDSPNRREYHQVKRQLAGEGRWSLGALESAGVLETFYKKLQTTDAHCVFVSSHAAYALEELADRARKADSFEEYERDLLGSATWRTYFDELRRRWGGVDGEWAWGALARLRVVTLSEPELASSNGLAAELLLEGDYRSNVATLIAVMRDRINERLTAGELWQALAERDVRPNSWSSGERTVLSLRDANERYRESRLATLIGGELIQRPQVVELADLLDRHPVVLLDGEAGMGKSDVVLGLTDLLRERKTSHLAFRLDRLTPTGRPERLGEELGLPASPPAVLAAAAHGEPCVLVIDQLDVVSTSSGRSPQFFECVSSLLRLAAAHPGMQVVLACRTFDIANDARLREMVHGQKERPVVTVTPLDHGRVVEFANRLGFAGDALPATQLDLLAVPLNLALLAEIAASGGERDLAFTTRRDLYDAFWKHKRRDVDDHLGRPSHWVEVIDKLVDHMSEEQVLRAPCELVDDWEADAEAMASSHMLVRDIRSYAFFHETFFDYLFARRFIARGQSLRRLLADDQLLFRRSQVRQVLTHERESDFSRYASDLTYLIADPGVRFHIKDLVLAWLSHLPDPTRAEWDVIAPLLTGAQEPLCDRAWRVLCSPGWFRLADERGAIETWLAADGILAERARWVIGQGVDVCPARSAELMGSLIDAAEDSQRYVEGVLSRTDVSSDRALFELLLRLLDHPLEPNGLANHDFWYVAHALPEAHPDWGCELLGSYLANRVAAAEAAGIRNALKPGNGLIAPNMHLLDFVPQCAERAPAAFVEHVWPHVLDVINETAKEFRVDELWPDQLWPLRHLADLYGDLDDSLLLGLETAFASLARDEPARFAALLDGLADTHSEAVVYLLYRGLAGNPREFADQGIDFVLSDGRRFRVAHGTDDYWATRQLLAAITPHCSEEALERISNAAMTVYPSWERSAAGHRAHGRAQFCLLGGIDPTRRSAAVRGRYAELQRKFGEDTLPPRGIEGGVVGSPIAQDAAERMTDEQWRAALARYDDKRCRDSADFLKGGAHQLSSVLEQGATADPVRFARLALTLAESTHPYYFDAILRGVGASEHIVPLDLTCQLCARCHALPDRPCGMWMGGAIVRHADVELPDEVVAILNCYATETSQPGAAEDDQKDLRQPELNSVRSSAARAIAQIVYAREDSYTRLGPTIKELVGDRLMGVRALAAPSLLALLRYHGDEALALFEALVDGADDRLLGARDLHEFLRYRGGIDFAKLKPTMQQMIKSEVADVRSAGAACVTLAALVEAEAHELAEECRTGSEAERLGSARVYAANLRNARYRAVCEEALQALFDDDSTEVRAAAATSLIRLGDGALGEFASLAQKFLQSQAAADNRDKVLLMLTNTTARVPELALNACEEIIRNVGPDTGDIRTSAARLAGQLASILVRAYADSDGSPALRARALDLIDLSLELNIYGTDRALGEYDRE
jgi:hypothetical protein